jgi:ElaB/YqjD/DUF883 family membrane-anchored ribosome-binding protein
MSSARADVYQRTAEVPDKAAEEADTARKSGNPELGRLITDVEDLVRKVAHLTDADIARVRRKVEQTLGAVRSSVEQGTARVRAGSKQLADATDGYVHDRPWTALGIAAAVGVLLGVLSARR